MRQAADRQAARAAEQLTPGQILQTEWMEQARNQLIQLSGSIAYDAMNPGLMALLISIQTTIALLDQEIRKRR